MERGFSIREYTSRMRSVSVMNCWPFDESFSEETAKSLLPPIVVERFTWWPDELQLLRSESEKETGKVLEKGETSSRNVDRDLEGGVRLVKDKSLKGKMRATKKRSIVEIFAVAPPVKRGEETEEKEEEEDGSCNSTSRNEGINRGRKNKKMKNRDVILRKALRVVKKIKRKKAAEKRGGSDVIDVPDKENCYKLKLHAQEKVTTGNLSSSSSNESDNDTHDRISNPKTKTRLQDLGPYQKFLPCKGFQLIGENQHPELPVRGILKNQSREFSPKQSKKCLLQKAVQVNKHVSFLESDELLRPSRKPSQFAECFELKNDCSYGIGSVDCAVAVGKDSTSLESSGSEDASPRVGKEIGAGPASNGQLAMFSVDSTTLGKQNSERSAMHRVKHWSDHNLRDAPHKTMDVCSPGFLHVPCDNYRDSQTLITTSSNTTCRRFSKEDLGTPCSIFPPLCFEDYLRTHNDTPMANPAENSAIHCAHSIHFQTLSPNELQQTFSSLPDGRRTNGTDKEFVGLPLNSQGELITLDLSAKWEAKQMRNSIGLSLPSNAASKCLGHHSEYRNLERRTSSRGQLNLFPVESYVKENAMPIIPSRLGIVESQRMKANLDFDFPELTICNGDNQVRKGPETEKCQSTMRLMGKEFEVGGRGVQGFKDGCLWKDKPLIDDLRFQNEPSFREVRVDQRPESKLALPQFDYKSVFLTRTVDCAQTYHPSLSPGTYSEVYNSKSLFLEPVSTGNNSQLFALEPPKASDTQQELCSNMNPSAIQLKNKQNVHYPPVSAIKFPFMHPGLDGHGNSSWANRSSLMLKPLCFDVSEKATPLSDSQSCMLRCNHPYPKPDDFCMFSQLPSASALQPITPAPLTPSPYYPGLIPIAAMQRKHGNPNRIKERINSRIGIRDHNICKKSKGQLSGLSNAHFKPLKRPILGFHEGIQYALRKPGSCISLEDSVRNMEDAFGSCSATQNSRFVMSSEYDQSGKDGQAQTILPFAESYTETARTNPVKLTGGSKHILKARTQKDQDISLSATNTGHRFS